MITPKRPDEPIVPDAPRATWRSIVLDVLRPQAGTRGLPLGTIYDGVAAHPIAKAREKSNQQIRAKVRQTLQRLRDEGVILTRGPGRWDIPPELGR